MTVEIRRLLRVERRKREVFDGIVIEQERVPRLLDF